MDPFFSAETKAVATTPPPSTKREVDEKPEIENLPLIGIATGLVTIIICLAIVHLRRRFMRNVRPVQPESNQLLTRKPFLNTRKNL